MAHSLHAPLLWTGVDGFFVLSGYLISGILLRTRNDPRYFRNFYRRRFFRIFPPYYLFLVLVFLVFAKHSEKQSAPFFFFYLTNVNSAFHLTPYPGELSAMWSLAIEEQFYIVWPFLVYNLRESRLFSLCLAIFIVSPLFRIFITLHSTDHWPTYYLTPCRVDLLAAGTLLAIAERNLSTSHFLRASKHGVTLSLLSLLIFSLLSLADPTFRTGANSIIFNTFGYSLVLLMMMGFLAFLIPRQHGLLGRALSWKPFVYLGVISYGLYMYHEIVLQHVRNGINLSRIFLIVQGLL